MNAEEKAELQRNLIARHHLFMAKQEKLDRLFETADAWADDHVDAENLRGRVVPYKEAYTIIVSRLVKFGRVF